MRNLLVDTNIYTHARVLEFSPLHFEKHFQYFRIKHFAGKPLHLRQCFFHRPCVFIRPMS